MMEIPRSPVPATGNVCHEESNEVVADGEIVGEVTTQVQAGDDGVTEHVVVQYQWRGRQLHLV